MNNNDNRPTIIFLIEYTRIGDIPAYQSSEKDSRDYGTNRQYTVVMIICHELCVREQLAISI